MVFLKERVGKIMHYFDRIGVAVIELEGNLSEGDSLSIEKDGNAFEQKAASMQIDRKPVKSAGKGEAIGMKVLQAARPGAEVYRITG